jgi:hypothetical protein
MPDKTNPTDTQKPRATEILTRMGDLSMYRAAGEAGISLSAFLEREDPSEGYNDNLDAFGRLLKAANIRVNSLPEQGMYADTLEAFDKSRDTRALFPEWAARTWRRAALGRSVSTRDNAYNDDSQAWGGVMRPYTDNATARMKQLQPAIPLSEVIAITTGVQNDAYRAFYLTDVAAQERLVRVAAGAELPRAKLTGGDHTIRLYKYGRLLEATYEMMRRSPIDLVGLHIARIAIQVQSDKLATVLDTIVNGDGNTNGATVHNQSDMDTGSTPTFKGWLRFRMQFANPYVLTHAFVQEDLALTMMLFNTGSANLPMVTYQAQSGIGQFTPINPGLGDGVRLGWTSDAVANKVIGIDARFAVERVYEVGADISETVRWVERQTTGLTLSEVEGYAIFDANACRLFVTNA